MVSLDILCSSPLNLKNKITKLEHKKIFCGPSKLLSNISCPVNICLEYFMTPPKKNPSAHPPNPPPPSYIRNVRYLTEKFQIFLKRLSAPFSVAKYQMSKSHYSIDITSWPL